jgi:hypothetical protein
LKILILKKLINKIKQVKLYYFLLMKLLKKLNVIIIKFDKIKIHFLLII